MNEKDLPEWKKRALADPSVKYKQARIIMEGPKCLTDAWFLQAMKFKYSLSNEPRTTSDNVED
jgi:hypothetical protein|tara:strand:+ start:231 stop:419 length:189 start_codon:yes stop_codon:yes gene_type:complete